MASKRIQGITIEIGADATPLNKAIKTANQSISKTQSGLRDVNKLLKMDPSSTVLLTQKQKALSDAINQTKEKLSTLKDASEKMKDSLNTDEQKVQYDALQREIIETEQNLKQLEQQAKQAASVLGSQFQAAGEKIQAVGEKIGTVADKVSAIGAGLTAKVTAPIMAGFTASAKAAIDWESAMTGVQKTVNEEYAGMYEDLGDGIKEMSTRMASSKEDIASVMEVAGQLGVSGRDNLLKFTETMVELGDTTNLSSDEAATSLARFLNITEGSYENVDKIGSAIVDLGNNFATSESEIVEMSTRLASAGTIAGLSSTEILALSAAMSSVGIQAEAGGTAMTQTMTAIEEAVAKAGDATADADGEMTEKLTHIAEISGMTADEFSSAWKDRPAEALTAFISGLGNLEEQGESATLVLDDLGMSGIRQSNMLKSLSLASDQLSGAMETSNKAYEENNALAAEAEKRYGTMASKIKQTGERIKNLGIDIGERLLPYIEKILKKVEEWVKKWDELSDSTKDLVIKIAGIAAVVGPVLLVFGKVAGAVSKITTGFGDMVSAIGKVMTAIKGMSAAMAAANIVLVAAAAAAGALIVAHIKHRQEVERTIEETTKLTDEQNELIDSAKASAEAFDEQTESMKRMLAEVDSQYISEQRLIDELNSIVDANGRVKQGYEERAQVIAGQLAESFGVEISYQNGVIQKYDEVMAKIDEVILKKKAEMLQTQMAAQASEAQLSQSKYWNEYATALGELRGESEQLEGAQRELADAVALLDQYESEGYESNSMLSGVYREQRQHVLDLKETVDKQSESVKAMEQAVADAEDAYYQSQATIRNYDDLLKAMESGSIPQIEQAVKNMSEGLLHSGEASTDALKRQATEANTAYQQMLDASRNGNAQISDQALQDAADFAKRAQEEFDKATEMAKGRGEDFSTGYADGMDYQQAYDKATMLADESVNAVTTRLDSHSPSEVMKEVGHDFVEGLALGIEERTDRLEQAGQTVKDALMMAFSGDQMQMGTKAGATAAGGMAGKGGKGGAGGNNEQAGFFSTLLTQFDMMITLFEEKIVALQEQIQMWLEEFTTLEQTWFDETWFVQLEDQIQQVEDKLTEHTDNLMTLQNDTWTTAQETTTTQFDTMLTTTGTKLDEIYDKFDQTFTKLKDDATTWGEDIIQNLIDGLDNMMPALEAKCQAIANMIASYIHFSLPEKGALSDMDKSMPDMINMMVKGIDQNLPKLAAANARMAQALAPDMSGVANMSKSTNGVNNRLDVLTDVVARYLPLAAKDRQVVLYPNKLVGALAPGMNRALGGMMA